METEKELEREIKNNRDQFPLEEKHENFIVVVKKWGMLAANKVKILGFTLEVKFVSSKHLIQVHLEILSCSVENIRILEPMHDVNVHIASISFWSSMFSSVV